MHSASSISGLRSSLMTQFTWIPSPVPRSVVFGFAFSWSSRFVSAAFCGGSEDGRLTRRHVDEPREQRSRLFCNSMELVCVDISFAGLKDAGKLNDCFRFTICCGDAALDEIEIGCSFVTWSFCNFLIVLSVICRGAESWPTKLVELISKSRKSLLFSGSSRIP